MASKILEKLLGVGQRRKLKKLGGLVEAVNGLEPEIQALSDAELRAKTDAFRSRLADDVGGDPKTCDWDALQYALDAILPEAFACAREAAVRTLGMRHFDVQVLGGIVLHQGRIAEMKTGEGKTLAATMPVYLNALTGRGVHVVTVNDYLARRDAEWMGQVYRFLGLDVGAIQNQMSPVDRRPIYAGDVIYGTNSEFGFDYLRDNMTTSPDHLVQPGHHFAVIDEVDSILIDEARTPLIISGAAEESAQWYQRFAQISRRLSRDRDYEVDEAKRTVSVTEDGVHRVEEILGIENLYDEVQAPLVHYLQGAIKAKELYKRDRAYVIDDGEIVIVDEFTGRKMPGRRWSDGIHQSVEAKEGVRIKEEHQTLATITIQNFFRMYDKLSGMTGTAMTEAAEFNHIYELDAVEVPTNEPMVRDDRNDLIYKSETAKFKALTEDIVECHERGQPVLVGTTSVEKNERLSGFLDRRGVPHEVLNAKNHEREGLIIAQAGKPGAVTVATNMAGRGVDIVLGGSLEHEGKQEAIAKGLEPETEEFEDFVREWVDRGREVWEKEHERVKDVGGLYVLGTERHESRRVDNQLRGRSGRQGDPGKSRFYLSLEDDLMQRFASDRVASIMERLKLPEDTPIEHKMVSRSIERAQSNVEQQNFEIRKNVLKYDDVLNTQREVIYGERKKLLEGEDFRDEALEMVADTVTAIVSTYCPPEAYEEEWDVDGLLTALNEVYPTALTPGDLADLEHEGAVERVLAEAYKAYETKEAELGPEMMRSAERIVLLRVLDAAWRDHLYEMDYLQEGIGLRAMGQRDPLVEYQREGYDLFQQLLGRIGEDFSKYIFHVQAVAEQEQREQRPRNLQYTSAPKTSGARRAPAGVAAAAAAQTATAPVSGSAPSGGAPQGAEAEPEYQTVVREGEKVGRNDPCPCGSGKKYKRCHGAPV